MSEHIKLPKGFYFDSGGSLVFTLPEGFCYSKTGCVIGTVPEGYYVNNDGYVLPIPTANGIRVREAQSKARADKTATLRGDRPSDQELRDHRARSQAARMKGRSGPDFGM